VRKLKAENRKTSVGGLIFVGFIIILFIGFLGIEQFRKHGERKALKYGNETICTITEISNIKTEFVEYYYTVNGRVYYSHKATPFSSIIPGEKFYLKYLKDKPNINMIQFDKPFLTDIESIKIRGKILRLKKNNKVVFNYKYRGEIYERWQLLSKNHFLSNNDSVEIAIRKDKPEIGIIRY